MRADSASRSVTLDHWVRRSLWLVACTIAYNVLEAIVALWAGVGAGSIALVGFGLDSVIELAAATVVSCRILLEMRGRDSRKVARAESRVRRFVGATFLALAAYVLIQSACGLWAADAPEESFVGVVLAAVSLIVMPLIAWGKLRAADAIGSAALRAEAKETLACSYLSFCLLFGLAANVVFGCWWADPLAALLMVPWLIREGLEAFEQDDD